MRRHYTTLGADPGARFARVDQDEPERDWQPEDPGPGAFDYWAGEDEDPRSPRYRPDYEPGPCPPAPSQRVAALIRDAEAWNAWADRINAKALAAGLVTAEQLEGYRAASEAALARLRRQAVS